MTLPEILLLVAAYYVVATAIYTFVLWWTKTIYPKYRREEVRRTWLWMCIVWTVTMPLIPWFAMENFFDRGSKE